MILGRPLVARERDLKHLLLNCINSSEEIVPPTEEESGKATWQLAFDPLKVDESRIKCPVLVISAGRDRLVPVSVQKKIAKKYHAEYVEFPDMGHMPMVESDQILVVKKNS